MAHQTVLVTGASSGIGRATVQRLAASGYQVFATARRIDRLEQLRAVNVEPLYLDITAADSITFVLQHIIEQTGRLDVLINNAGYALYGVLEEVSPMDARRQFDVNVFGMMQLTQAVLPIMRQQHGGTIINLSSVAGKIATPMAGWYCASKHAVEALSDALRMEVAPLGIKVILIEPGSIKTEFGDIALNELSKASQIDAYKRMATAFNNRIQQAYRTAPGPEIVAETIHKALQAHHPNPRYAFPNDSRLFILLRRLLSDRLLDSLFRTQFAG
jgi:NADP-dependent 3-hydroxy acid dehydrogenase YdfG